MGVDYGSVIWLIVVGALWGGTNPFLRRGTTGLEKVTATNPVSRVFKDLFFLVMNWKYMLPFLLNQSGSVIYFLTLQNTEMSIAVPVANSLTFVFTAISGWLLGEDRPTKRMITGMLLVVSGVSLCILDKTMNIHQETPVA